MSTEFDTAMMAHALQLAERGRFWARPNPHVGCVLVRDGEIIGEGFTQPAGDNHAEVEALQAAGDAAGATAYVTLEPCSHVGRTGPCADALVAAGVSRVVVAMEDPNPAVAGGGLAKLRGAGVDVQIGTLNSQANALLAGFVSRMTGGRPRVRVKLAMSVDGRTAMASGESQWITGPAARSDVQRLRAASCAIVTGSGTVVTDDCSLTVRADQLGLSPGDTSRATARPPMRVIVDSRLRTPRDARVLSADAPTLICHGLATAAGAYPGAELIGLPGVDGGLDLNELMDELGRRHCNEVLVESGPRLAGALLSAGLVDELVIYMAPVLMGSSANPLLYLPLDTMAEKVSLNIADIRRVGDDYRIRAVPA